jgi:hypothetical protein
MFDICDVFDSMGQQLLLWRYDAVSICVCSRALDTAHLESDVVLFLGSICKTFRYAKRQAEQFTAAAALPAIGDLEGKKRTFLIFSLSIIITITITAIITTVTITTNTVTVTI